MHHACLAQFSYVELQPNALQSNAPLVCEQRRFELIETHMSQRPVSRVEVGARALRVQSVSREGAWASAGVQDAWVSGCGSEAD